MLWWFQTVFHPFIYQEFLVLERPWRQQAAGTRPAALVLGWGRNDPPSFSWILSFSSDVVAFRNPLTEKHVKWVMTSNLILCVCQAMQLGLIKSKILWTSTTITSQCKLHTWQPSLYLLFLLLRLIRPVDSRRQVLQFIPPGLRKQCWQIK